MKSKKVLTIVLALMLMLSIGCIGSNTTEINIVATTDLHGEVPYNITEYIKIEKENRRHKFSNTGHRQQKYFPVYGSSPSEPGFLICHKP